AEKVAQPIAEEPRPCEGQAHQDDQEHPQEQQQEMPKSELALIGPLLQLEKSESGKEQMFRLLPHDEVNHDRQAEQQQTAQKKRVNESHALKPALPLNQILQ